MKFRKSFSNNMYIFFIILKASPLFTLLAIINAIRGEWCNYFEHTYGICFILESIEYGRTLQEVMRFLTIILVVVVLSGIYSGIYENYFKIKYMPRIKQKMKEIIYKKAMELDLEYYDNPEYYNDFVLSVKEVENSVERMFQLMQIFFGGITLIVCYGSFFLTKDILSIIFASASFFLGVLFKNKLNTVYYNICVALNPLERKRDYIRRVFYLNSYAKELRLNKGLYNSLYQQFDEVNDEMIEVLRKNEKRRFGFELLSGYISTDFIMNIIYVIYLVYKAAVLKLISYSSVVVLFNSVGNLQRGLSTTKDFYVKSIELSLYVDKIKKFLNCSNKVQNEGIEKFPTKPQEICLKNVSFRYNEKDKYILDGLNMTIKPYQKIAIVGNNGAGKSTLIKLLLRLYDVNSGTITYGNKNIKNFDIEDFRKNVGVVFQDFNLYAATVNENVVMDVMKEEDRNKINTAISKTGFDEIAASLEKGTDTELTKEFAENGTDLSGGERQKLALARGFYEDTNLIILDEPSSALDPVSEYNLNQFIFDTVVDKTVIFISHRLSTTRRADKIFMIENGKIVEEGTHDELVQKAGKYAAMWNAQASKYFTE